MPQPLEYFLHGPQAEPTASFWLDAPAIRVPTRAKVERYTRSSDPRLRLDANLFPDEDALEREFEFIKTLEEMRAEEPYPLVPFVGKQPPGDFTGLTELSRFLHLRPPPFGTVFDTVERPQPGIDTVNDQHLRILRKHLVANEGQELARIFEEETPGLFHRHALNWLLFLRPDIAPPRQARIGLGLDMAVYTALSAAWYWKWRGPQVRLLRPSEYAARNEREFTVHYDRVVSPEGHDEEAGPTRKCPRVPQNSPVPHPDSPGTPRHPAWPSGHSTYSAAATYMLEYFFSPDTLCVADADLFADFPSGPVTPQMLIDPRWIAAELRRLANNIGEARLWGGVHWVSDHVAGQRIGRSAARAVIDSFLADRICEFKMVMCDNDNLQPPPSKTELTAEWEGCRANLEIPEGGGDAEDKEAAPETGSGPACSVPQPFEHHDAVPQPEEPDRRSLGEEFGIF